MTKSLRDEVFEALDRGLANEPDLASMTPEALADDLTDYDALFEHIEEVSWDDIREYAKEWLNGRTSKV